jgi:hypothetical protein
MTSSNLTHYGTSSFKVEKRSAEKQPNKAIMPRKKVRKAALNEGA